VNRARSCIAASFAISSRISAPLGAGRESNNGEFEMHPVDLWYDGPTKDVDLPTICELMLAIERGEEGDETFELSEPDLGSTLVYVSLVGFESGATSWILSRERRRNHFYLAMNASRKYLDGVYLGCPERIRAGCLLSLEEAVSAIEQIMARKKLAPPLRWISRKKAIDMTDMF
jgi:hypothetical protein